MVDFAAGFRTAFSLLVVAYILIVAAGFRHVVPKVLSILSNISSS